MNRLSPSDVELSERLFWLVKLRWLFLIGLSALLFFAVEIFGLRLELPTLISIAAIVLAYNLVLFVVHRLRINSGAIPIFKVLRIEANLQIGLDLIALIFLVYFSGGIENPFTFFFIFHMIVGSILLAGRDIWYHAFITVFGLMTLLYLSLNGYVPHHHIEGFASPGAWRTPAYVYSAGIAFSATMLLTVYMTSSISRSVWKREQELIGANDELRKKSVEIQSANRELIRQQNLLVQSEKLASLGKLSAGVAHELNNPLTGIMNFAYFIKDSTRDNEQAQKDVLVLIRETTRCKKIIKGLLDFARQSKPERRRDNVLNALVRTTSLIRSHKDFKDIEIIEDYDRDIPDVMYDLDQMQQVFMNLIVNAQEAMQSHGTLYIRARYDSESDSVEIRFKDTGPGVGDNSLDMIFDPFFTTKEMGTGLGLSISMGIVDNHNGRLLLENEPGKGATFVVRLPVANGNGKGE